jgi:Flp pilus assembly protein TadB
VKIKNLTASDFPGIDEAKFNEWKARHIKLNREHIIFSVILLAIWFISTLLIPGRVYASVSLLIWAIVVYGFDLARGGNRVRQLKKELKMSERMLAKKKGRVFNG